MEKLNDSLVMLNLFGLFIHDLWHSFVFFVGIWLLKIGDLREFQTMVNGRLRLGDFKSPDIKGSSATCVSARFE